MSYFTVCTPTYNRSKLLRRPFESLMNQTFYDFEWLIIDDGSMDNTKETVESFISTASFPIRYIRQENKGKTAALNTAYHYINSEYTLILDSDDALTENALQVLHDIWESIPKADYDRFWCITGQCIDIVTGKIIGGLWPDDINNYTGRKQHKMITRYKQGEKYCCRKTKILKEHPFPEFDDTRFVPESVVWEKVNKLYDQFCTNEILRFYYTDSSDALSKKGTVNSKERRRGGYYKSLFLVNECFNQILYNKDVAIALPGVCWCGIATDTKYRDVVGSVNKWYKKIIISAFWPCTKLLFYIKEK